MFDARTRYSQVGSEASAAAGVANIASGAIYLYIYTSLSLHICNYINIYIYLTRPR